MTTTHMALRYKLEWYDSNDRLLGADFFDDIKDTLAVASFLRRRGFRFHISGPYQEAQVT